MSNRPATMESNLKCNNPDLSPLMAAARLGQQLDVERFYRVAFRCLMAFARERGIEAMKAEDLTQETILISVDPNQPYEDRSQAWSWLKKVFGDMWFRSRRRESTERVHWRKKATNEAMEQRWVTETDHAEDTLYLRNIVALAIQALPPGLKAAIQMKLLGWTVQQISTERKVTAKTVYNQLDKANQCLARHIRLFHPEVYELYRRDVDNLEDNHGT